MVNKSLILQNEQVFIKPLTGLNVVQFTIFRPMADDHANARNS